MIIFIVSVLLLQIWITSSSGCGLPPTVTLNCDNRSAHVHWAPSQTDCHNGCRGYWICRDAANVSNYHTEQTGISCVQHWNFDIPWDYYFCNVTMFYEYFDLTDSRSKPSPNTIKSCENNLIEIQRDKYSEVGRPYEASCTVYTGKLINSDNVNISWIGPDGVIANDSSNSSRITVTPITTDGYIHTSTLQFSYISEEDKNASYDCIASLSSEDHELSKSFTINNLTWSLTIEPQYGHFEVGKPHKINCALYTVIYDNVNISWIGPDGDIANDSSSRITVTPTTTDGYIHTSTLQFSYISEEDENISYNCTASLSPGGHEPLSKSFNMSNLMIPYPNVNVRVINQTVGNPLSLECNVNIVRGITSNVNILWMADNKELRKDMRNVTENITAYTYYYNNNKKLTLNDNNTVYSCNIFINSTQSITVTANVTLYVIEMISPSPSTSSPASTMTHSPTTIATGIDSSPIDIPLVISSSAAVITVALIICFAGYCICIGKRNFKFPGFSSQYAKQLSIPQWSIDDDYYTVLGVETSTVDNEYNKGHENKWMHHTEMSTLDEEQSSTCSLTSVSNEKMLDYILHTKEHSNTNAASTDNDTQYCENCSISPMFKNDTGCSSQNLTRENESYISEKAAFAIGNKKEKPHLENMVEEEKRVQSPPAQIILSSPLSCYITLDSQFEQRASSPFQIAAEETNESPMISEGDYFPDTIAGIQFTSDSSPNAIEEKCGNGNLPSIPGGEYIPCTSEYISVSVTKSFQQNCTTGPYNAVPLDSLKQETLNNYNFPYVDVTEDDISTYMHRQEDYH